MELVEQEALVVVEMVFLLFLQLLFPLLLDLQTPEEVVAGEEGSGVPA